jgi:hypothetical protein
VLAVMLVPIAVVTMVVGALLQFFRQAHTPEPVSWVFLGFLILIFGLLPASGALAAFMRSRFGRTTVTVSTAGIRIDERGAWRTKAIASLDAAEIMDVDYSTTGSMQRSAKRAAEQQVLQSGRTMTAAPVAVERTDRLIAALSKWTTGHGITVKTRQGLTTFAQGLADDEIRYLHSVVRKALTTARAAP